MMNSKELPPDDWHSEIESAEERERLKEIERRLKTSQPNPVQLDAAAWERIIAASQTPRIPGCETAQRTGLENPLRRRRLGGVIGTIAAAWLSGVIVGSGVMFLTMNRGAGVTQTVEHPSPVVLAERNRDDSSVTPDARTQSRPSSDDPPVDDPPLKLTPFDSQEADSSTDDGREMIVSTGTDSVRAIESAPWLSASGFERQEPLRALDRQWFAPRSPTVRASRSRHPETLSQEERVQQSESQRELVRSFVPPPGATPRRILEELRMNAEIL